jgi:hypothetical protein
MARKAAAAPPPNTAGRKRAVVIVHGIGDQMPMQTLRSFVDAVWSTDNHLTDHGTRRAWTKPDVMSHNLELRRITTSEDKTRIRTDFYEFYWAHMMSGTRLSDVIWWIKRLFWRPMSRVPEVIAAPWFAGLIAIILLVLTMAVMVLLSLKVMQVVHESLVWAAVWALPVFIIAGLLWFLRNRVLAEFVGDAARYLTPAPQNIAARTAIRQAGLALLNELHENEEYGRIILVCHSLGTVVGYDLLNFFWNERNEKIIHDRGPESESLKVIDAAARKLRAEADPEALADFRTLQRDYARRIMAMTKGAWKITDFVTLGSPLAHAHVLLVDDGETLNRSDTERTQASAIFKWYERLRQKTRTVAKVLASRIAERAFPICPPEPEVKKNSETFFYSRNQLPGMPWTPNHAAVFAPVRWTNIYAPRENILWGDVIAGPVAPLFGPGVKDIALKGPIGRSFIAHVKYWLIGAPYGNEHLAALRAGLNLLDEPEAQAWARYEEEIKKLDAACSKNSN